MNLQWNLCCTVATVKRGVFGLLGDFGPKTILCLSIVTFRSFIIKLCYVYVYVDGNQYQNLDKLLLYFINVYIKFHKKSLGSTEIVKFKCLQYCSCGVSALHITVIGMKGFHYTIYKYGNSKWNISEIFPGDFTASVTNKWGDFDHRMEWLWPKL